MWQNYIFIYKGDLFNLKNLQNKQKYMYYFLFLSKKYSASRINTYPPA